MTQKKAEKNKKNLVDYCERFAALNVSSTQKRGNAQYKPILLLSVIDLIAQGVIQENKIFVSDDLINIFYKYWRLLASEYKGGLHYPFLHLQNERFWHLVFKPDFNGLQPKTLNKLKQAIEYAELDDELFSFIQEPESRQELIDTLISVWLISAQKEIEEILVINQSIEQAMIEDNLTAVQDSSRKYYMRKSLIRDSFFRKSIVHVYNYQCSLCRLKVTHSITQNIVDGAHIKPFSKFYDNQVDNGIAFCKNHHWAFDQGLFTLDDNYQIVVANDFTENSPNAKPLKEFHSERISLPSSNQYFPRQESLQWHRNNIFRK